MSPPLGSRGTLIMGLLGLLPLPGWDFWKPCFPVILFSLAFRARGWLVQGRGGAGL